MAEIRSSAKPADRLDPRVLLATVLLSILCVVLVAGALTPPIRSVEPFRPLAERWGGEYGIDPDLVLAVAAVESKGDPTALSPAGAGGLMRERPTTDPRELAPKYPSPPAAVVNRDRYRR